MVSNLVVEIAIYNFDLFHYTLLLNFILILPGGFFDDASTVDANTAANTHTAGWILLMLLLLILICRFC